MRLDKQRRSQNIEDRRRGGGGGGGLGIPPILGNLGIGGVVIVGLIFFLFPQSRPLLMSLLGEGAPVAEGPAEVGAPQDQAGDFVAATLGSVEDAWTKLAADGKLQHYGVGPADVPHPTLVLFAGQTPTACGLGAAASGPFYCPADRKMYLDTTFFEEMERRLGAGGDFAQAYVIAHEYAHHVQNLLGLTDKVAQARRTMSEKDANQMSVRLELQADCFAGVWGNAAGRKGQLSDGDLEEALAAANAIGDDRLQKAGRGYVVPDSFTHGTSAQRMAWFRRGFDSGDPAQCDTFAAASL